GVLDRNVKRKEQAVRRRFGVLGRVDDEDMAAAADVLAQLLDVTRRDALVRIGEDDQVCAERIRAAPPAGEVPEAKNPTLEDAEFARLAADETILGQVHV